MVPSRRMLWLVAAGFPAAVAGGLVPALVPAAVFIWVAIASVTVVDALISRRLLDRVRIKGPVQTRAHKDRPSKVTIELNAEGLDRLRLAIDWPRSFQSEPEQRVALPSSTATLEWTFTPRRRGDYAIQAVHLEHGSSLGLWDVRRSAALDSRVRVYPNLQNKEDALGLRREVGFHSRRQVGKGREFEKLREYLPGDGFDEIHWKATARRGRPITKVFQIERTREVYVAIDASRLTSRPAGNETRLERYITAALITGAAAQRNGDKFGLVTFHARMAGFVRAGRGPSHQAVCREAVYRLQPQKAVPDFDEIATQLRLQLRGRALIVFLTDLDDPATAEGFRAAARMLNEKHLVAAAMMRPPHAEPLFTREAGSLDDVYEQLGGHMSWRALKETEARLRQEGVRMALLEEASFTRQLVELYDEIKQRQLL